MANDVLYVKCRVVISSARRILDNYFTNFSSVIPSFIIRRQFAKRLALNDTLSESVMSRALKFGTQHCLVHLYQICANGGPMVLIGSTLCIRQGRGPAAGRHGL